MSEYDELKEAILANNMSAVCRAYEALTGESIKPKREKRGRKTEDTVSSDQLAQVMNAVQQLQARVETNIATADAAPAQQRPRFGGGPNRFNPEQFKSVKEPGEDAINDNAPPTPRGQRTRETIEVKPNSEIPPPPGRRG